MEKQAPMNADTTQIPADKANSIHLRQSACIYRRSSALPKP